MIARVAALLAFAVLLCGVTSPPVDVPITITPFTTPQMVQYYGGPSAPYGNSVAQATWFQWQWPNPILPNDTLVCGITYVHGFTPSSITSAVSGLTWSVVPGGVADAGTDNLVTAIYVANVPDTVPATGTIETTTVNFASSSAQIVQVSCGEFNHLDVSPVNGASAAAGISANGSYLIDPGSFTPTTNNNANGGNVIWNYTTAAQNFQAGHWVSTWTPAPSFTLLDAGQGGRESGQANHGNASQWYLQSTQASVDPVITAASENIDPYNSVSVALKVDSSRGSTVPSGIHLNKILHQTTCNFGGTWDMQFPVTGNLRVFVSEEVFAEGKITDSDGNTYTIASPFGSQGQTIWYAVDNTHVPSPNMKVSAVMPDTQCLTGHMYDIQGAATSSPLDVAAGQNSGNQTCETAGMPFITPNFTNELIIAQVGMGNGPAILPMVSPSGSIFNMINYNGQADENYFDNSNGEATYYNGNSTAQISFAWTAGPNAVNTCSGGNAAAFKHG